MFAFFSADSSGLNGGLELPPFPGNRVSPDEESVPMFKLQVRIF